MPTRLMVVLLSCLLPTLGECAAPFVPSSEQTTREPEVHRQFVQPLALPILDDGSRPLWAYPYERIVRYDGGCIPVPGGFHPHSGLADLPILHPPEIHPVSLSSRSLTLHLDTAGVGKWDTALVELWITRDGWTWQLFQKSFLCDSFAVTLPGEGRYGMRVVVQKVDGLASPPPHIGEQPQLWIDVNEQLSFLVGYYHCQADSRWPMYSAAYRAVDLLDPVHEFDQPTDVKETKQRVLSHPCGYIKRVEAEKICIPESIHRYNPALKAGQRFIF